MCFKRNIFHHWDYFVTAPALGYLHGQALNTQVYSQYGTGFPLLFALLNPIYRLSYGHIFQFTNIYTCVYICGVYLFLRRLLRNPSWAAFGAFAFIYYKLFNWTVAWDAALSTALQFGLARAVRHLVSAHAADAPADPARALAACLRAH